MVAHQVITTDSAYQHDAEEVSLNPRIRSVILHTPRPLWSGARILGIWSRRAATRCHDLRRSGYQVAVIELSENGEAGRFCHHSRRLARLQAWLSIWRSVSDPMPRQIQRRWLLWLPST